MEGEVKRDFYLTFCVMAYVDSAGVVQLEKQNQFFKRGIWQQRPSAFIDSHLAESLNSQTVFVKYCFGTRGEKLKEFTRNAKIFEDYFYCLKFRRIS